MIGSGTDKPSMVIACSGSVRFLASEAVTHLKYDLLRSFFHAWNFAFWTFLPPLEKTIQFVVFDYLSHSSRPLPPRQIGLPTRRPFTAVRPPRWCVFAYRWSLTSSAVTMMKQIVWSSPFLVMLILGHSFSPLLTMMRWWWWWWWWYHVAAAADDDDDDCNLFMQIRKFIFQPRAAFWHRAGNWVCAKGLAQSPARCIWLQIRT